MDAAQEPRSEREPRLGSLDDDTRVVVASGVIDAPAGAIFELIADPSRQPEWDGNDNLDEAASGQRVRQMGDVFAMMLTKGEIRENHVVDFEEGRRIAWAPAPEGGQPFGQVWRWELQPLEDGGTLVVQTYDWTDLHDEKREQRARATTEDSLLASIARLRDLAEREARRSGGHRTEPAG